MSLRREESLRSQRRDNLLTLGKVKVTHKESEQFSERAQKQFDRWFFSLPSQEQARLRADNVLPYREQGDPRRRLCQLFTNSNTFAYEQDDSSRTESETFYSREKVLDILSAVLNSLSVSNDPSVRLHFEFVRTVLKANGHYDGVQIGQMYGLTKAAVNLRVLKMRKTLENAISMLGQGDPGKESPPPPTPHRRVSHRRKKIQASRTKPKGCSPCRRA